MDHIFNGPLSLCALRVGLCFHLVLGIQFGDFGHVESQNNCFYEFLDPLIPVWEFLIYFQTFPISPWIFLRHPEHHFAPQSSSNEDAFSDVMILGEMKLYLGNSAYFTLFLVCAWVDMCVQQNCELLLSKPEGERLVGRCYKQLASVSRQISENGLKQHFGQFPV